MLLEWPNFKNIQQNNKKKSKQCLEKDQQINSKWSSPGQGISTLQWKHGAPFTRAHCLDICNECFCLYKPVTIF